MEPMKESCMSRLFAPLKSTAPALLVGLAWALSADAAFAQQARTLGSMTNSLYNSVLYLQTFLSLLSYILGIFFSITGIQMLRDHVDDPGRNPVSKPLLRLAAAGFFIFAPTLADIIVNSIGGGSVGDANNLVTYSGGNYSKPDDSDQGLDAALVRFVDSFAGPFLDNLLPYFAYAAGLIFMLVGLKRLALANGDGPQAPGGMGTMMTFFVAAALMAFGYVMATMQFSIFGTTSVVQNPAFKAASADADLLKRSNQAMWGVFVFLRIVGYISVLRGLFMLRAVGEGGNVSMMAVGTHMIAGALLANGTAFVLAVQDTFIKDQAFHILQQ